MSEDLPSGCGDWIGQHRTVAALSHLNYKEYKSHLIYFSHAIFRTWNWTNNLLIAGCETISLVFLSFPCVHTVGDARSTIGVFYTHVVVQVLSNILLLTAFIIRTWVNVENFSFKSNFFLPMEKLVIKRTPKVRSRLMLWLELKLNGWGNLRFNEICFLAVQRVL